MKPVIALIGRPNVGKSTLFNQITKSRDALVADFAGLTRDRKYGDATYQNKSFIVVDTGGIGESEGGIDNYMAEQSKTAINEADIIIFVVDARAGLLASDEQIARELRTLGKKIYLVANKVDGVHAEAALVEFYKLGMGEPLQVAASHGRGVQQMLEDVLQDIPEDENPEEHDKDTGLRLAIIGRPNVGKSTLVNRLLGEDRVVAFDQPGTTRDSIYIPFEREGRKYTLIDTAGVRRKGKVDEMIEKFSIVKTLQAMKDAHVVVVVVDAREGIVEQDLHLIGYALEAGRAMVIAINKWDNMSEYDRKQCKLDVERRFDFIPWARIHLISALHGTGVGELYPSIHRAYESANLKVSPAKLTQILNDATDQHQPPTVQGRRIKMRYAHMGGQNPPTIVIHGNKVDKTPADYRRYLENVFRKVYKLEGTPVKIEFKTSENPFEGRKSQVDERAAARRRRYIQKFKKAEKKFKR
ncbi:TPA: ribosome biogenesis GTPase Der [Acinetobacter baumannii]|uniref:ribosome biogenesis GTPase Der n=1 Tax=Acinetobacter baumannii TaxID=470 RepID=UPI000F4FC5B9|nr:ribosome biogenesis GTPase Der [Acinetobacter baumannii]AYY54983.1 ribosome biogenesis GTPase Der [Acinetobacter baumannii]MBD0453463.1 ribosome biogenesis GTPase Der [Acinetobacter baumannii]MBJ9708518.1 ribosome biogenesis GTPase Der [Acinetobacter baumannii]MCZ3057105.1 ribosome biogenesis GTPase Der [Acinetobacter baumannii]MDC5182180.1 ribosome biogenesis GTPase Der [Acinetobacter baumannii]